nr:ribonuclease H-like domain-containing protein [Tanacetum cinerariifolium]
MFDCDEMFTSETDDSLPASPKYDRYHSRDRYHAIPPPYTGTFMPPKPDLVFHDSPNVNETVHTAFNVELSTTKPNTELTHRPTAPIIEDWVFDSEDDSKAEIPHNAPYFVQPIEQKMAQTPARNHAQKGNHQHYARMTLPNPQKHVVPTAVLTKTINRSPSPKVSTFPPKVTAAKVPMVNVVKGNWIQVSYGLGPKETLTFFFLVRGNPQHALTEKRVIDSGCSRYMTGNMSYLSDFEEINGGYVGFGGNLKGGKISDKGKIGTGKLDFDDVYFVKELKFNLFSVSQMCDKKTVFFLQCFVLSPEFKLTDENQVLLRVPRENNMYNVDLKNIVPSEDLT